MGEFSVSGFSLPRRWGTRSWWHLLVRPYASCLRCPDARALPRTLPLTKAGSFNGLFRALFHGIDELHAFLQAFTVGRSCSFQPSGDAFRDDAIHFLLNIPAVRLRTRGKGFDELAHDTGEHRADDEFGINDHFGVIDWPGVGCMQQDVEPVRKEQRERIDGAV